MRGACKLVEFVKKMFCPATDVRLDMCPKFQALNIKSFDEVNDKLKQKVHLFRVVE
jgi:hypothetical protein